MSISDGNSSQLLQEHFEDPYHRGDCEIATHAAQFREPSTQCEIRFEFAVDDLQRILEAWWDGDGCQHCEGLASLLCESIEGATTGEVIGGLRPSGNSTTSDPPAGDQEGEPSGCATRPNLQSTIGHVSEQVRQFLGLTSCTHMVCETILQGLQSPLSALDDDLADGQQFGGPSLREEC